MYSAHSTLFRSPYVVWRPNESSISPPLLTKHSLSALVRVYVNPSKDLRFILFQIEASTKCHINETRRVSELLEMVNFIFSDFVYLILYRTAHIDQYHDNAVNLEGGPPPHPPHPPLPQPPGTLLRVAGPYCADFSISFIVF